MNINNFRPPNVPKFKMPEALPAEALVFPVLCGYHTYQDYKKAPKETKKETLLMRLFILAGTSMGILAGHKGLEKILQKVTKLKQIQQDIISSVGVPLGGIVGGFVAGSFAEGFCSFVLPPDRIRKKQESRYKSLRFLPKHKKKDEKENKFLKKLGVITSTILGAVIGNGAFVYIAKHSKDYQAADLTKHAHKAINLIFAGVGMAAGLITGDSLFNKNQNSLEKKTIENTDFILTELSSTVSAFDSVDDDNLKNRVQKGFYGVISSVVVPSSIVLPTVYAVKNYIQDDKKFEKHFGFLKHVSSSLDTRKSIVEKGISIPLSVATYYAGDYIGNVVDEKITKRFMEKKFWTELEKRKQKALEDSIKNLQKKDTEKLQKSLQELQEYEKLSAQVKSIEDAKNGKS